MGILWISALRLREGSYFHKRLRHGICASFFLSFSSSQVVNFLKWKHHYLSENISLNFFTQYLFLNEKRCHSMTFSWRLESERTRGKRNHKFRALGSSKWCLVLGKKYKSKTILDGTKLFWSCQIILGETKTFWTLLKKCYSELQSCFWSDPKQFWWD